MNKHRVLLLPLIGGILLLMTFPLMGVTQAYEKLPYGIGVQFSPSIWGLSYHQRVENHAIQGTVGIIYDPTPLWDWDSMLSYGIAIDYQRTLYGNDFNEYLGSQIYTNLTLAHSGEIDIENDEAYEAKIIVGAGFGVEVLFFQNFSLPVELVYEISYSPTQKDITKAISIDLVPKVSLRFRFK